MKLWQALKPIEDAPWPAAFQYISRFSYFDAPTSFSQVLAEECPIIPGETRLLDLGCATGIIGIYSLMEKNAASATFTDVVSEGLSEARCNVIRQIEANKISESQVDFIGPISYDKLQHDDIARHTLIAFNPPQLPLDFLTDADREGVLADPLARYFRFGGRDGLKAVREFLQWYSELECNKPPVVINLSGFLKETKILQTIDGFGLKGNVIGRRKVRLRHRLTSKLGSLSPSQKQERSLTLENVDGKDVWMKLMLIITITHDNSGM